MSFSFRFWWTAAVLAIAGSATQPASAALGASADSIGADRVKAKATVRIRSRAAYTVHELTTPSGTVVHEYLNPSGKVFGVAWSGPAMPDLRQLLGDHFDTYTGLAKSGRRGHAHRSLAHEDLVVHSTGRLRAFSGQAYLQTLIPNGVSPDEIR
jgi:hypothetical protein